MTSSRGSAVHSAEVGEIDPRTLYRILALRSAVFVVEQECAYLDPDGRDLLPGARQLWIERDGAVVATLRVLPDAADRRIGRVVTDPGLRGSGLARELMQAALVECGSHDVVLDAQSYLADWYGTFGFVPTGPEFLEDGLPHIPMRRAHRSD